MGGSCPLPRRGAGHLRVHWTELPHGWRVATWISYFSITVFVSLPSWPLGPQTLIQAALSLPEISLRLCLLTERLDVRQLQSHSSCSACEPAPSDGWQAEEKGLASPRADPGPAGSPWLERRVTAVQTLGRVVAGSPIVPVFSPLFPCHLVLFFIFFCPSLLTLTPTLPSPLSPNFLIVSLGFHHWHLGFMLFCLSTLQARWSI